MAIFIDSATITGTSSVSASESHIISDSGTVTGTSSLTSGDLFAHEEVATITSRSTLRTTETSFIDGVEIVDGGMGTAPGEPPGDPLVVAGMAGTGDTDSGTTSGIPINAV